MNIYGIKIKSFCGVDLKAKEPVIVDDAVVGVVSRNKTEVNTVSNYNKAIHYYSDIERNKTTVDIEYDIKQLVVKPDFSGLITRNKAIINEQYRDIKNDISIVNILRDNAIVNSSIEIVEVH